MWGPVAAGDTDKDHRTTHDRDRFELQIVYSRFKTATGHLLETKRFGISVLGEGRKPDGNSSLGLHTD